MTTARDTTPTVGTLPADRDAHYMRRCIELASRAGSAASPNPMVGCVVVSADGAVVGEGFHERYGGPHAEVHAVAAARRALGRDSLAGCTVYVNLEPCSHHGKTPPCADLLVASGPDRVVVGIGDPNRRVDGRGLRRLRDAGIEVTEGVESHASRSLNEAFFHRLVTGRPFVHVKVAQTLDGFSVDARGRSKWITGDAARRRVHAMRAAADAVMVGTGTALKDDPRLTVRDTEGHQPLRLVLDRTGRLPPALRLFTDDEAHKTVVLVADDAGSPAYAPSLTGLGGRIIPVPQREGRIDLVAALRMLAAEDTELERPIQHILAETGPELATSLLASDLVDRVSVFVHGAWIGGGRPAVTLPVARSLDDRLSLFEAHWEPLGEDALFTGRTRPPVEHHSAAPEP